MSSDSVKFEIVFEIQWFENTPPWPWPVLDEPGHNFYPITDDLRDEVIGSFMAGFVPECDPPDERPWKTQLEDIIEEGFFSHYGGVIISNHETIVKPGCCADLTTITEWPKFLEPNGYGYLGHDPYPWASVNGEMVQIWQDGGPNIQKGKPIEISKTEFSHRLAKATKVLPPFREACLLWLSQHQIPRSAEIGKRIVDDIDSLIL